MAAQASATYETWSDRDLAAAIARRDPTALRLVTTRNNQRLFRAAWSILRNKAEAEDAVQDAYIRAFAAIDTFHGDAALSTWLTRIVINEALGRRRTASRRAAFLEGHAVAVLDTYREKQMSPSSSPEGDIMRKQLAKALEAAVARLPDGFRTVFVLREVEGMSIADTAVALGINEETVKTRFHRARIRLREMLDPELKSALGETAIFAGADCVRLTARVLERLGLEPGNGGDDA